MKKRAGTKSLGQLCDEIDMKEKNEDSVTGRRTELGALAAALQYGSKRRRMLFDQNNRKKSIRKVPSFEAHRKNGSFFCGSNESDNRLTKGTNILSWDCGISNLCYCLIEIVDDAREFDILMWENLSLGAQTLKQATTMLVKELDSRPWMMDVDHMCIENQVLKNCQMKVICHNIQCYFETKAAMRSRERSTYTTTNGIRIYRKVKGGPTINLIKADSKFAVTMDNGSGTKEVIKIPDKIEKLNRRTRNKKAAVYMTEEILKKRKDYLALKYLQSFTKQDDLSDSLLQGIYYLREVQKKHKHTAHMHELLGITPANTVNIESMKIGTKEEVFANEDGLNEGCEYEEEVLLPRIYKSKYFILPQYDTSNADISTIKKFMRASS